MHITDEATNRNCMENWCC